MSKTSLVLFVLAVLMMFVSCEIVDDDISKHTNQLDSAGVEVDVVAGILASIPLGEVHLKEVHTAVTSSSSNGYDEEYTMKDLFERPGAGVGDDVVTKLSDYSENPLRNLIQNHLRSVAVKSVGDNHCPCRKDPEAFLNALMASDVQIYWPYSENWDGVTYPVITFDPLDGSETNIGYKVMAEQDGSRRIEKVIVDEKMAMEQPVWVVNRNSDAGFMTLELLRRQDPNWGQGGGEIIVDPTVKSRVSGNKSIKSLIMKDFTMKRNFDSWFAGASEFMIKCGYVKDFTASTEAELKLYNPSITDFVVVVKRNQVGIPQQFNTMLISQWCPQMLSCAFLIMEDDGGTLTEIKCTALVRIASKSYGLEVILPCHSSDDLVWRGSLSCEWLESGKDIVSHFGDVDITFGVI